MHPYHKPVEIPFTLPTRIYGGMLAVWLLRPNLQRRFPVHKNRREDYLRFLAWCTAIGRRECDLLTEIEAWNQELQQPVDLPCLKNDKWTGVFNTGMYLAGLHRAKYCKAQVLGNPVLRHRAARWYFREGRHLIKLQQLPQWQIHALGQQFKDFDALCNCVELPKDNEETRRELRYHNADILKRWGETVTPMAGIEITPEPAHLLITKVAGLLPPACNRVVDFFRFKSPVPSTAEVTRVARKLNKKLPTKTRQENREIPGEKPFGVNLYGYARGELGIGEDVRMLALAFMAADVPFCIINIEPGVDVSQEDTSVEDWVETEPRYNINIFCITGIEMCRYVSSVGMLELQEYYNIGLWPWELPAWPEAWHHCWSLVDELWGISHYTAEAYAQAPVPVHSMPLPVETGEVAPLTRIHWGLPEHAYLFVFSFDMNSKPARKNPAGLIRAFQKACAGKGVEEVGLVLKISHLKTGKPHWKSLEKFINADPRIHLISTELRRPEVLALYKNCDCYVSLHRSEGFGRGLAEAQLLGLQLIATGYSGNMEFCNTPPTRCVNYTLKPLEAKEYFYGDGQYWADPEIDHAAQQMLTCLEQGRLDSPVVYDTQAFAPAYCGEVFKQRLHKLMAQINTY